MSASVIISNTFATQSGPIPLSQLDANFTQVASALNSTLNFTNYAVDSGAVNAYSVSFASPATVAYTAGLTISFKAVNANTGASTLNVNSLGTKSIVTPGGSALSSGAIAAGQVATVVYDGTNFQLQSVAGSGGSAAGSNTQVQFNSSGSLAGSANLTFDGTNLTGTFISTAGSANGVAYLTGTKQLTSASGFTVSGTTWTNTGSFVIGSPTGGDKGAGTINATNLYVNGVPVVAGSGPVSGPVSSTDYGLALWNGTSGLSLRSMAGTGTSGQFLTSAGAGAYPTWTTLSVGVNADPRTLLTTKTVTYGAAVTPLGSLYLSATTQMIVASDGGSPATYYASVYDSGSDTMGSPVAIASVTSSGTPGTVFSIRFLALSSTSVLIAYADSTNSNKLTFRVLSISGTSLTANTSVAASAGAGYTCSEIVAFGSSYIVNFYDATNTAQDIVAVTVSGTTVTAGTPVQFAASTATSMVGQALYAVSSGSGITSFTNSGTENVVGFTVSGTTITAGTPSNFGSALSGLSASTPGLFKSAFATGGGRVSFLFCASGSAPVFVVCSLSGTTVTATASVSTGTFFSGTIPSYYVQSGGSVLLVGFISSVAVSSLVFTDTAGTASVSSTVSVANGTTSSNIIPTSSTTIGVFGTTQFANVSISGTSPSIAYSAGGIIAGTGASTIYYKNADSSVSKNLYSNGTGFYNVCLGSSNRYYLYQSTVGSFFMVSANASGQTALFDIIAYGATGAGIIDPTNAANCWIYNTNQSTTAQTLYRVQYA